MHPRQLFIKKLPLLDQAVVSGGNFVQSILLARLLGAEVFGAWVVGQLALLFTLGLHQAALTTPMLTFFGRKNDLERAEYLRALTKIQVLFSLILGVFATIFAAFFFEKKTISAAVFGSAVVFSLMLDFHRRRWLGLQKAGIALVFDVILMTFQLGCFAWFGFLGKLDLPLAWQIWLVANGFVAVFGFLFLENNRWRETPSRVTFCETPSRVTARDTIRVHWQESRWLLATAILQWFSGNFLLASASIWLGQTSLGVARMAQNTVGVLNILFISLENTLPAPAARLFDERGRTGLTAFLKTIFWKNMPFVGLFLLGLVTQSERVFRLLFGQSPDGTRSAVVGFAVVYLLTFAALPLRVGLRTVGRSWSLFLAYVVSAVFSMLAARPLLEKWGFAGLTVGLVVCQILQLAVYFVAWFGFFRKNKTTSEVVTR
jgi:O-antigen/teichoic acid export membrane protein